MEVLLIAFGLVVDVGSEAFLQSILSLLCLILQRVTLHDEVVNVAAEPLTEGRKVIVKPLAGIRDNLFNLVDALIQQLERCLLLVLLQQLHLVIDVARLFL